MGEASFNQSLNETWYGLTWSHTWGEHAGIGISHFLAIRKQRSSVNVKAEVLTMEDEGLISTQEEAVKFRNYRFVWKLGLAYQRGPIGVGVAITTPSLNLSGKGSSWRNVILFGVDLDSDGAEDPVFDANSQDRLEAFYSSPLSMAVGVTARLEIWALHVSGEWFNKVPSFDVLRLEAYQGQSSGEVRSPSVAHRLDAVLNGAVGIEKTFSEQFQGFVSFATDFSGAVSGDQNILFLSEWDLFHLTTGTSFSLGQAGFTLGVGYAFGSETEPRSFLLNEVSERNLFFDIPAGTGLTYRRWKFIIGFEYDTN